jgi:hypothetical protein
MLVVAGPLFAHTAGSPPWRIRVVLEYVAARRVSSNMKKGRNLEGKPRPCRVSQPMAPYSSERTISYLSTPATVSLAARALSLRSWSAAPSLWRRAPSNSPSSAVPLLLRQLGYLI